MCDDSEKLITWLDHELSESDAADVERHIRTCVDCRSKRDAYARVSRAFDAYCDALCGSVEELKTPAKVRRWAVALSAAAAAGVLLVLFSRGRPEQHRYHPQAAAPSAPAAVVPGPTPRAIAENNPVKRPRRKHSVAPVQSQDTDWMPAEPAIQIAIPAEAMFPPGAVPEGVNFTAEVSMAADGSVQRLRLRPRLAGLERSSTQP